MPAKADHDLTWLYREAARRLSLSIVNSYPPRDIGYPKDHLASTAIRIGKVLYSRFCLPGNGLLQALGLRVVFDLTRPQGRRVTYLTVSGDAVNPRRVYTVVTMGFLARGYSGFHWFREAAEREVVGPERSLVIASLRESKMLPEVDDRLQFKVG